MALLAPFNVQATVVRRSGLPVPGAVRTVRTAELHSALPGALVVFVALALSPETVRIISDEELGLMGAGSWLVNVARGRHVDTDALVRALSESRIGGAALDVTDPEPLPDGHPLWSLPNCLVTPHTADTEEMVQPLLASRIRENVQRLASGLPLVGVVDTAAGY
jgi:phosphoglycerate dehydrogenase-like enzyme